jgi:hypothetical protein
VKGRRLVVMMNRIGVMVMNRIGVMMVDRFGVMVITRSRGRRGQAHGERQDHDQQDNWRQLADPTTSHSQAHRSLTSQ